MTSLAVMGVGRVGGEVAYLAAVLGLVDEIVMYDVYKPLLHAQVLDLAHTGLDVAVSTDTEAMKDADIFIFAAGTPRSPDIKTRADLLEANLPVVQTCCRHLKNFDGIVITITNPMDVNNYGLYKLMAVERNRCIGFGGQLDSARFGSVLRDEGLAGPAFVLGEHGEHQVPIFSRTAQKVGPNLRESILARLRSASMEVIKGKGGTVFGPAYHIAQLVAAVVEDRRELLPCSCVVDGEYDLSGCSVGVPARIGREGVIAIEEWNLDPWEQDRMEAAGTFIRELARRFDD